MISLHNWNDLLSSLNEKTADGKLAWRWDPEDYTGTSLITTVGDVEVLISASGGLGSSPFTLTLWDVRRRQPIDRLKSDELQRRGKNDPFQQTGALSVTGIEHQMERLYTAVISGMGEGQRRVEEILRNLEGL